MAASFAAYASQFLNKQQSTASSVSSSGQPLFYSFSTDEGSTTGRIPDADLDDEDDPHLNVSNASTTRGHDRDRRAARSSTDDEDPYLRLDEDDPSSAHQAHTQPLLGVSQDTEASKGWLAHQASPRRSPSTSTVSSDDSRLPPALNLLPSPPRRPQPPLRGQSPTPPPPPQQAIAFSLTESLLPRDGHARPVDAFSLPDPRHVPRGRRKHNDSIWIALWCTAVGICVLSSVLVLFLTHKPAKPARGSLPYTTLLHTVPLLTILTFVAAGVAYAHIFLLRIFVRPAMIAMSLFIPATLFISAVCAFVGSFMWEAGQEPTWGETVGLRLFALIPLILCILSARRLLDLPRDIHTTSALLNLASRILLQNPLLLALSPAILLAALLASLPFLTLVFRLLLIGYFSPSGDGVVWHVQAWADWAICGTLAVWLWSWAVARGVLRVSAAGVVGAWYFADQHMAPPPPMSTHTLHAALFRATQPSLGSIALSALILTGLQGLALGGMLVRRLPAYLPVALRPFALPAAAAGGAALAWVERATRAHTLSSHALVYVGLTGAPFGAAARRARVLTQAVESASGGAYKRKFRTEPPLTLLTVAPLTLTFPFALGTYLFVAHTLGAPDAALGAAVLGGAVTALVGMFCVGLVKDTTDTLYVCYCIDKEAGVKRREEVTRAFEYETRKPAQQQQPQAQQPQARQPPLTVPTPTPAPAPVAPLPEYPYAVDSQQSLLVGDDEESQMRSGLDSRVVEETSEEEDGADDEDGDESALFPGSDLF